MFVITGGGSGIGRALAIALANRDKKVFIVGRRKEALQETAGFSKAIAFCVADVSTEKGRQTLIEQLVSLKTLEGLIHNAGIIDPIEPLAKIKEKDWHHILETNLNAPLFLSQALIPKLKNGRVLHIGSGAAHFPVQGWGGYCVSKAALSMLNRCWQLESKSTAFAAVMPGIIDTDMQALIRHSSSMDSAKYDFFHRLKQEHKLISAETVASFLVWLLLDTTKEDFAKASEWDIYDPKHHPFWLKTPHQVPPLE